MASQSTGKDTKSENNSKTIKSAFFVGVAFVASASIAYIGSRSWSRLRAVRMPAAKVGTPVHMPAKALHPLLNPLSKRPSTSVLYVGEKTIKLVNSNSPAGWLEFHERVYRNTLKAEDLKTLPREMIDVRDEFGQSPMWWACHSSKLALFRQLKMAGSDLKQVDDQNRTLLHAAASCVEIASELVDAGVPIAAKDASGCTVINELRDISNVHDDYARYSVWKMLFKRFPDIIPKPVSGRFEMINSPQRLKGLETRVMGVIPPCFAALDVKSAQQEANMPVRFTPLPGSEKDWVEYDVNGGTRWTGVRPAWMVGNRPLRYQTSWVVGMTTAFRAGICKPSARIFYDDEHKHVSQLTAEEKASSIPVIENGKTDWHGVINEVYIDMSEYVAVEARPMGRFTPLPGSEKDWVEYDVNGGTRWTGVRPAWMVGNRPLRYQTSWVVGMTTAFRAGICKPGARIFYDDEHKHVSQLTAEEKGSSIPVINDGKTDWHRVINEVYMDRSEYVAVEARPMGVWDTISWKVMEGAVESEIYKFEDVESLPNGRRYFCFHVDLATNSVYGGPLGQKSILIWQFSESIAEWRPFIRAGSFEFQKSKATGNLYSTSLQFL